MEAAKSSETLVILPQHYTASQTRGPGPQIQKEMNRQKNRRRYRGREYRLLEVCTVILLYFLSVME
jgi:hypothetical protein